MVCFNVSSCDYQQRILLKKKKPDELKLILVKFVFKNNDFLVEFFSSA